MSSSYFLKKCPVLSRPSSLPNLCFAVFGLGLFLDIPYVSSEEICNEHIYADVCIVVNICVYAYLHIYIHT